MLKSFCKLLFLITILNVSLWGQNWSSYTNTDNVRRILINNNQIWGVTSGGIVSYRPSDQSITKLTNVDGLGGINYYCISSDTTGNIWCGTSNGWLTKLLVNGNIKNYSIRDSTGYIARPVSLFDLKTDGLKLWIANDLGVSKFMMYSNGGEIKDTARKLGNLPNEEDVTSIAIVGENLWAGTARGVAFINKDTIDNIQYYGFWRSFSKGQNGLGNTDSDQNINSIISYRDTVVIGTLNGVYKFTTDPDTLWIPMGLQGTSIVRLAMIDTLLMASAGGQLFNYNGSSWVTYQYSPVPDVLNDIVSDSTGILWGGTRSKGLTGLSDSTWNLYSIPGPASNIIRNIAIDSSGSVWMTHSNNSISILRAGTWTINNSANSPYSGQQSYSITVTSDHSVWIGDWGRGLFKFDGANWFHWDFSNSPMWGVYDVQYRDSSYWAVTDIAEDFRGDIWMNALDAVQNLTLGVFYPTDSLWHTFFTGPNSFPDNDVHELKAQGNVLWVGREAGLDRFHFGASPFDSSSYSIEPFISREFILDLALDPDSNLWFGSLTGLFYTTIYSDSADRVAQPLELSGRVNAVESDGAGNIWVGTGTGIGVLNADKSSWRHIYNTSNSPLLNNSITDIAVDKVKGTIYIGTEGGLSIFESGVELPNINRVEAYPNPVIVSQGESRVRFKRIPPGSTIFIYNVAGELVARVVTDEWNLKNSNNQPVAGGIYIFQVRSGNTSGTGKLAIIK